MNNNLYSNENINYRALYGKLFSGLLNQFGTVYFAEIEDAIQNSFLKSLKIWNQNKQPNHIENWLFIVARNDVLNQIKKHKQTNHYQDDFVDFLEISSEVSFEVDLRLQTLIFIAGLKKISNQAKIIFVLKNIFGLNISEISTCTLIGDEAIYKSLKRTKNSLQIAYNQKEIDVHLLKANKTDISVVEPILYAVFTIGFDSFNEKIAEIINEDLCLEAFSLAKNVYQQYKHISTSHLLALFCFHIARIPAKIENGKLISFFNQNRGKWNKELIDSGFYYLQKPNQLTKIYLEAVIISKYMGIAKLSQNDWADIIKLYELMLKIAPSPILKLNYCFCLSKINELEKALKIISEVEKELPNEHLYLSLVKAKILKEVNHKESEELFESVLSKMNQKIRKAYLLENHF